MKIINIYEVERYGKSQLLWEREDGTYKITDTGQNRLSHMTIEKISDKEAKKLIDENLASDKKSNKKKTLKEPLDVCNSCGDEYYDILGIGKCGKCFIAYKPIQGSTN